MKQGIKITWITIYMLVLTLITTILFAVCWKHCRDNYNELLTMTENYSSCQQQAVQLQSASQYLTDQCRQYVLSGDISYMRGYFDEVNVMQRRERALENIKTCLKGENGYVIAHIESALTDSQNLMATEIHAMKLVSVLNGYPESQLPEEIQQEQLTAEEKAYTPQELREASYHMVFDQSYVNSRKQIDEKMEFSINELMEVLSLKQEATRIDMKAVIERQGWYFAIMVITVILSFLLIYLMVIRILNQYAKNIENGEMMNDQIGTMEFRYLARAYNRLLDATRLQEKRLKFQVAHDPLTGLLNRNAIATLADLLKAEEKNIALLIIDVDHFKEVNDSYGHEMGDWALKRIASLLSQMFREKDYLIRFGGDEFVAIMTGVGNAQRDAIGEKIAKLNEELQKNQSEMFPKLSVSVGIAFSHEGYTKEVFQKADEALYKVKENGRCGYQFF